MEKDNRANLYSPATRARPERMVLDNQGNYESQSAAINAIAPKIGCGRDPLRRWVQQEETDTGCRDGVTSEERARIKDMEREVWELRQANEILKKGEPMERQWSEKHWRTRILPRRNSTAHSNDDRVHRRLPGRVWGQADLPGSADRPSTFYEHKAIERDPVRPSDRAKLDEVLRREVQHVWDQNFKVYGVRKVWHKMRREGFDVARCELERLMQQLGITPPHITRYSA